MKTIWDKNFNIDPKFTKNVRVQGKQPFTNIDTYYLLKVATEQFGSYGAGFGIDKMEWSEKEFKDGTIIMTLDAEFFYISDDKKSVFPIRNSLKYAYSTKNGYYKIDEDVPKKLMTNTIAKALSYLGFGASVYMGLFEDVDYVDMVNADFTFISNDQRVELSRLIQETQTDLSKFNASFSISKLTELPVSQYNKAVALLNSKKAKLSKKG